MMEWSYSASRPGRFTHSEIFPRFPFDKGLDGLQSWSGCLRSKILKNIKIKYYVGKQDLILIHIRNLNNDRKYCTGIEFVEMSFMKSLAGIAQSV
jgi:hypothetical protein